MHSMLLYLNQHRGVCIACINNPILQSPFARAARLAFAFFQWLSRVEVNYPKAGLL